MSKGKLLIFSLMRTGCIHYSATMVNNLKSYDPEVYVSTNPHGLFPNTVKQIPTYFGIFSALMSTIIAIPLLFIFTAFKKLQYRKLQFYFTAFHPWNFLLVLYAKFFGINTIHTIHELDYHRGDGNMILRLLKRLTIHLSDKIIMLSQHEIDETIRVNKSLKSKIYKLTHPLLDWPGLKSNQLPFQEKPKLLMLGRINLYKGLGLFTQAVKPIINRFEVVTVAGKFQRSLRSKKIEGIQYIDKYLTEDEVAEFLSQYHILVLPYTEASQSGIIPLGLQTSIPMVITNVGGLIEQLDPSNAIFVYPSADDIRKGIEELLDQRNYSEYKKSLSRYASDFSQQWDRQFEAIKRELF